MKKSLLILLSFLSSSYSVFAQKSAKPKDSFIYFDGYAYNPSTQITHEVTQGVMDTRIFDILDKKMNNPPNLEAWNKAHPKIPVERFVPKESLLIGIRFMSGRSDYPTYKVSALSKKYSGRLITDSSAVEVLAMGINPNNVDDYRFRIIENDSIQISPWQVPKLQQKYGAKKPYAFLGEFRALGKQIMVEVINTKDYNLRDGMIISWGTTSKPEISDLYFGLESDRSTRLNSKVSKLNHGYADRFDPITKLPLNFSFPQNSVNALYFNFKNKILVPYDVLWVMPGYNGITDTVMIGYNIAENKFTVDRQYLTYPGSNELLILPSGIRDPKYLTKFSFEVTQTKKVNATYSLRELIPYLVLLVFIFLAYYLYNKRKLNKIRTQKKMANLQLSSLRSQLNPHFMFNALTSIQNLVNQNDNNGANHYLTKFAQLTRQVLKATGQELISLEDEVDLLSSYLEMEKLRFGFDYEIIVSPEINSANLQIPSMLMQPFIENAAKYGVSAMGTAGKIQVIINKEADDLVLIVKDNGPGFNENVHEATGVGLKLSHERIRLLNEIYNEQNVTLNLDNTPIGVTIAIKLTNWL